MAGRNAAALHGANALAVAREASRAAVRAAQSDADQMLMSRTHERVVEQVSNWAGGGPKLEAALAAGRDYGSRVIELRARVAAATDTLDVEKAALSASLSERDRALAVVDSERAHVGGAGKLARAGAAQSGPAATLLEAAAELAVPPEDALAALLDAAAGALPAAAQVSDTGVDILVGTPLGGGAPASRSAAALALQDVLIAALDAEAARGREAILARPLPLNYFGRKGGGAEEAVDAVSPGNSSAVAGVVAGADAGAGAGATAVVDAPVAPTPARAETPLLSLPSPTPYVAPVKMVSPVRATPSRAQRPMISSDLDWLRPLSPPTPMAGLARV
jgi:hypothetical protein